MINNDVILMGTSKSGKSSIKKVVFEHASAYETVLNEPTLEIDSIKIETLFYCKYLVTEFPSTFRFSNMNEKESKYFESCRSLIYVIDSQDTSNSSFDYFKENLIHLINKFTNLTLYVFIHKNDCVNECKTDSEKGNREIKNKFDLLKDSIKIQYFYTSIYDYSLYESFSQIFQKTITQHSYLNLCLEDLHLYSGIEKSYLFDIRSKIYLATDNSPSEKYSYQICSETIDMITGMSCVYGNDENENNVIDEKEKDGNKILSNIVNKLQGIFKEDSASVIKVRNNDKTENNFTVIYLKFIDQNIVLICTVEEEYWEKLHMMNFNVQNFKNGVKEILNKK